MQKKNRKLLAIQTRSYQWLQMGDLQISEAAESEEQGPVMERDWLEAYRACPTFGPWLVAMEDAEATGQPGRWPE